MFFAHRYCRRGLELPIAEPNWTARTAPGVGMTTTELKRSSSLPVKAKLAELERSTIWSFWLAQIVELSPPLGTWC